MDRVPVNVGGAEFELCEVLDRAQAALRAVDLLVEEAAQTHRIQPEAPLLGTVVRVEVKLSGRVTVHVAVQTGDAQARLGTLAVISGVELLLREEGEQQAQAVELNRGQQIFEQAVKIINRDDLAA